MASDAPGPDHRCDPYLGTIVHVVGTRQSRPNLPQASCPFCPGGLEAPEPYVVRSFPNRWPAMAGDRCEVVLYTADHDATLWSLGVDGVLRVIDLWAERTLALGGRDDVDYVLVFENRGAAVGATIDHPHGQIYAYDHVPSRPLRLLTAGWSPDADPGERAVSAIGGWQAYVPHAPTYPVAVTVAPNAQVADLASLTLLQRLGLANQLVDVLARLDALYGEALPYMLWVLQRPTTAAHDASFAAAPWLQIEIVSPWRAAGVSRFIAAAEVSCEEYFNPVVPEVLAERLRALG